jgi:small subunit ribosomal protein S17
MEVRKPSKRKIREGIVLSNKMQHTVTVRIERRLRHPQFEKVISRGKKCYAHNDKLDIPIGAKVRIIETRPLSKMKRWRVLEVLST